MEESIFRGDIVILNFGEARDHTIAKTRPAVIIQNNLGNKHRATTIVAPITSNDKIGRLPIGVCLEPGITGLDHTSYVNLGQIHTIDRINIIKKIGTVSNADMKHIDRAIRISLGLEQHSL
jgi:mRNA interferase MazF